MKYRTIQKEVDAIRFNSNNLDDILEFFKKEIENKTIGICVGEQFIIRVYSDEDKIKNLFVVLKNDFLIRDSEGNIFSKSFEDFLKEYSSTFSEAKLDIKAARELMSDLSMSICNIIAGVKHAGPEVIEKAERNIINKSHDVCDHLQTLCNEVERLTILLDEKEKNKNEID